LKRPEEKGFCPRPMKKKKGEKKGRGRSSQKRSPCGSLAPWGNKESQEEKKKREEKGRKKSKAQGEGQGLPAKFSP